MAPTPTIPIDLGLALSKFIQDQGLSTVILFALFWFATRQVWPWWVTVAYPSMQARTKDELHMMKTLTDAVVEMKILIDLMVRRTDFLLALASKDLSDEEKAIYVAQAKGGQTSKPPGVSNDARS
jgi:hypothetical protein